MKKSFHKTLLTLFLLTVFATLSFAQFHRGVNLTNWFQANSPRGIQFNKFTKKDLENIKSLDCDVIRLPINLHSMTSGEPDYTIDPLLWYFLDQVLDWAEELNINIIIDNHSFDPSGDTSTDVGEILKPVWRQIAERYKNRSRLIYYEILNEPHGISSSLWNAIQGEVINEIRQIDTVHTIVVTGTDYSGVDGLKEVEIYADTNLIYTFHFYEPFLFTHQGASWVTPSMEDISGIPFPYDPDRMPALPSQYNGTWIQSIYNAYSSQGNENWVDSRLSQVVQFRNSKNIKVYCGEFGVYMLNSENDDRVEWYRIVREYFDENNIPWTIWDYKGGFGLFEKGSSELFDYDLNVPLLEALGMNIPPQKEFEIKPDSVGFKIYDDYPGELINLSIWNEGYLDFYDDSNPAKGNFCIHWTNANRYNIIGFDFLIDKDLTYLLNNGYFLRMYIKGNTPNTAIDVRFIDTKESEKESETDHPWRKIFTINDEIVAWNNTWQYIEIPLTEFVDGGSWDNGNWYDPIPGIFDWTKVDRFEIVAEHSTLSGVDLYFDEICISNKSPVDKDKIPEPKDIILYQNFPNPFNSATIIKFYTPEYLHIEINLYDLLGRKIGKILDGSYSQGMHEFIWNVNRSLGEKLPSGSYICRVESNNKIYDSIKMLYMK